MMLRKILMGVVWFVVLYFAACMVVGLIAGIVAGLDRPVDAGEAGKVAGGAAVAAWHTLIVLGSLLAAGIGSATGFLPWTKTKPK